MIKSITLRTPHFSEPARITLPFQTGTTMADKQIDEYLDIMSEMITVLNNEDDEDQNMNAVVNYLQVYRDVLTLREAKAIESVKGIQTP